MNRDIHEIIELLESIQQRPLMYIGRADAHAMECLLCDVMKQMPPLAARVTIAVSKRKREEAPCRSIVALIFTHGNRPSPGV
ncbi:MAG TPA: hypothetical protein VFD58_32330, partial [Blastocatellia bacterium]|nr:hypothetical protein [Blastocatellia bacterium]